MAERNDDFTYDVTAETDSQHESVSNSSTRNKVVSASVTGVLVFAGLAGGAAFALTRLPAQSTTISSGSSQSESTNNAGLASPTAAPTPTPSPTEGKTIVVPPAPFDDKGGERNFHNQPADGAAQASTSATATPSTPPSFGGGEHEGDGRHHGDFGGVKPPRLGHDNQGDNANPDSGESDN
jgi:hypothetical protein